MNSNRWLTGASILFVLAMLAACGGGGGGGSTAAPPPDNSAAPPDNVAGFAYVTNLAGNVSAFTIDATTGELSEVARSPFAAGDQPFSISVDPSGKFAYVVNLGHGIGSGNVSAYTINTTTGELSEVAGSPFAAGSNPKSVTVDPSGKFVYVANASDFPDTVSTYTINETTGALTSVGAALAAGLTPNAIAVDPSGKFVYVANSGSCCSTVFPDNISAYTINAATGALSEIAGSPFIAEPIPFSVTVDPSGKFVYVANSDGDVSAYAINPATGALTSIGTAVTAGSFPISVTVDPSGKFVYVANRSSNDISAYTINATTGALTSIGAVPAGTVPISVTVDPSGKFAYVANSASSDVSAYTINATTGALTSIGAPVAAGTHPTSITTTRKIQ